MISDKKVLSCAETLAKFCKEQKSCQNCIFRLEAFDHWDCQIRAYDLQDTIANMKAKKLHHGYIG